MEIENVEMSLFFDGNSLVYSFFATRLDWLDSTDLTRSVAYIAGREVSHTVAVEVEIKVSLGLIN